MGLGTVCFSCSCEMDTICLEGSKCGGADDIQDDDHHRNGHYTAESSE